MSGRAPFLIATELSGDEIFAALRDLLAAKAALADLGCLESHGALAAPDLERALDARCRVLAAALELQIQAHLFLRRAA